MGSNAIQLAAAAGYEVVTTASPRNFDFVRKLGAGQVFDHHSPTVVDDVLRALQGTTVAGALAIGNGSAQACADVVSSCRGTRFVSMATPAAALDDVPQGAALLRFVLRFVGASAVLTVKNRRRRIRTESVFGSTLAFNEVSTAIYQDFLPWALADGRYVTAPEPSSSAGASNTSRPGSTPTGRACPPARSSSPCETAIMSFQSSSARARASKAARRRRRTRARVVNSASGPWRSAPHQVVVSAQDP